MLLTDIGKLIKLKWNLATKHCRQVIRKRIANSISTLDFHKSDYETRVLVRKLITSIFYFSAYNAELNFIMIRTGGGKP